MLLPQTSDAGARILAERLREAVAACPVCVRNGEALFITATIGVTVTLPGQPLTLDALLAQADDALYAGKAQGRNRVCVADGRSA